MAPLSNSPEPLHVIACGALAREITGLIRANGLGSCEADPVCRQFLHNRPERIPQAVAEALDKLPDGAQAFVAYADCGTGGQLARVCDERGAAMFDGPHCYALYETRDLFGAHDDEITAFYLTDFIARQFDAFVWKPLGLDRHPELRDSYFGHYTKDRFSCPVR